MPDPRVWVDATPGRRGPETQSLRGLFSSSSSSFSFYYFSSFSSSSYFISFSSCRRHRPWSLVVVAVVVVGRAFGRVQLLLFILLEPRARSIATKMNIDWQVVRGGAVMRPPSSVASAAVAVASQRRWPSLTSYIISMFSRYAPLSPYFARRPSAAAAAAAATSTTLEPLCCGVSPCKHR